MSFDFQRACRTVTLAGAAAGALAAAPALSQAWIGQIAGDMAARAVEAACMAGTVLPEREIAEARDPALKVMQLYWSRASAADGADITPAFHAQGKAEWKLGDKLVRRNALNKIADPLARGSGMTLAAQPMAFVRASDGATARGLWPVTGAGAPAGFYLADFKRSGGIWKLQRVEVLTDGADQPQLTQYCHKPGDVEVHRAKIAEIEARRAARKAAKEAARAKAR